MDRAQFLEQLNELFEVPPGTLEGPEELDSLDGWNSVTMVGFMGLADEHFGVIVSPRNFGKCITVNDLVDLIEPLRVR